MWKKLDKHQMYKSEFLLPICTWEGNTLFCGLGLVKSDLGQGQ